MLGIAMAACVGGMVMGQASPPAKAAVEWLAPPSCYTQARLAQIQKLGAATMSSARNFGAIERAHLSDGAQDGWRADALKEYLFPLSLMLGHLSNLVFVATSTKDAATRTNVRFMMGSLCGVILSGVMERLESANPGNSLRDTLAKAETPALVAEVRAVIPVLEELRESISACAAPAASP